MADAVNIPEVTVLAVGGAGCRILREFVATAAASRFRLLALDSDADALKLTGLPESSRIQAGRMGCSGRGCGGDVMAGQMAASHERRTLAEALEGTKILLVIAGLGGGFASGGLPVVFGVAAKMNLVSILLCTLPFDMEGFKRRKLAEERIAADILPVADAVIALPNDLLFHSLAPEVPLAEAFRASDEQMARSLLALALTLSGENLFNADFSAFTAQLKRRRAQCALGVGVAEAAEDAPEKALSALLASPLLGGAEPFDTADTVLFSLLGGPELSLGQARAALELASRQIDPRSDKTLLLGAATVPELAGKLQLIALTVRYPDAEPAPAPTAPDSGRSRGRRQAAVGGFQVEQPTLPNLDTESKGIMENTAPVVIDGQDMDVPAYKRRGLALDLGK